MQKKCAKENFLNLMIKIPTLAHRGGILLLKSGFIHLADILLKITVNFKLHRKCTAGECSCQLGCKLSKISSATNHRTTLRQIMIHCISTWRKLFHDLSVNWFKKCFRLDRSRLIIQMHIPSDYFVPADYGSCITAYLLLKESNSSSKLLSLVCVSLLVLYQVFISATLSTFAFHIWAICALVDGFIAG